MIYKPVDIPNYQAISDKVYDFIVNDTNILQGKLSWNLLPTIDLLRAVPELNDTFKYLGDLVPAKRSSIVMVAPGTHLSMHIDERANARLLWPIRNCAGSYTRFFDVADSDIEYRTGGQGDKKFGYYHIKNPRNAVMIGSVELTQPIVFEPSIPHDVLSNVDCKEPRLTMTLAFVNNIEYMLE